MARMARSAVVLFLSLAVGGGHGHRIQITTAAGTTAGGGGGHALGLTKGGGGASGEHGGGKALGKTK